MEGTMKRIGVVSRLGTVFWRKQKRASLPRWKISEPFYIVVKILFMVFATSFSLYGFFLFVQKDNENSVVMWMLAFFCMLFVWAIEAKLRSAYSLYKTED